MVFNAFLYKRALRQCNSPEMALIWLLTLDTRCSHLTMLIS